MDAPAECPLPVGMQASQEEPISTPTWDAKAGGVDLSPRLRAKCAQAMACVRELLLQHLEPGAQGDEDVLEYVIGVMEDDDFEFGDDGEDAFDAVGDMMVGAGYVTDEQAARDLCKALAAKLKVNGVDEAEDTRASTRMLEGGPKALGHEEGPLLFEKQSARHLIQTPFENDKDLSMMTERDRLRLEKRMEKDEKSARAAMAAAQARADSSVVGSRPTIMRNTGGGGVRDIHLEDVSVSNGGQELITDTSATFAFGRRYGLVGRNGSGKSTLLRHMSAYELKGMPSNCQVLHVEQEVAGDDTSVLQAVLECDQDREQLLVRERQLLSRIATADPSSQTDEEASTQLAEVYRKMEEIDAYGAEARAASILAGLSFTREMQQRPTRTFSGGWRMRVALARALFVAPDLLLLDEPTNHLDLHAVLWLEDYLLQWPKTVIIVSHAREFLNATCTDIIHLHSRKLTFYRGNYDNFQKTMQERMRNQLKAAEGVERERKHMQSFIDKFRFNAKRAALVQSRIKALSRLADVQVMERDPEYLFSFPDPGDTPNTPIIGFTDVSFNYPGGPTLFKNLNFGIDLESRLAIVGPNGVGKSTLLKLISGDLTPVTGTVSRNPRVRIATFSQHHVDGLDLALTPLLYMMKCYPNHKEHEHRAHLGKFGIDAELAGQGMHTLSGGQKNRVALARVTWTKPHILLLDEPSNHLDMDAVDALIEGLTLFKGGVLMVSHDQFLIETTVDELWMCEGGEIMPFHGSFSDYKKRLRSLR